ncbi:hypothetical protein B0H16DRAFT_162283 [Mycena metata]|uniref:Uncharacterized protein n=1 Tax=Mycena metata TaxID=1033252 RepID=A0AAD7I2L2_9AGAR|nr:hypothetical protein B0H16DRAFT_162283 [Mycena metata]
MCSCRVLPATRLHHPLILPTATSSAARSLRNQTDKSFTSKTGEKTKKAKGGSLAGTLEGSPNGFLETHLLEFTHMGLNPPTAGETANKFRDRLGDNEIKGVTFICAQERVNNKRFKDLTGQHEHLAKVVGEMQKHNVSEPAFIQARTAVAENRKAIDDIRDTDEEIHGAVQELRNEADESAAALSDMRKRLNALEAFSHSTSAPTLHGNTLAGPAATHNSSTGFNNLAAATGFAGSSAPANGFHTGHGAPTQTPAVPNTPNAYGGFNNGGYSTQSNSAAMPNIQNMPITGGVPVDYNAAYSTHGAAHFQNSAGNSQSVAGSAQNTPAVANFQNTGASTTGSPQNHPSAGGAQGQQGQKRQANTKFKPRKKQHMDNGETYYRDVIYGAVGAGVPDDQTTSVIAYLVKVAEGRGEHIVLSASDVWSTKPVGNMLSIRFKSHDKANTFISLVTRTPPLPNQTASFRTTAATGTTNAPASTEAMLDVLRGTNQTR